MKILRAAAGLAALCLFSIPAGLDSCSIAPPSAVFATAQRPADLRGQFLRGKLGVLRRSYQQGYLLGAFRILSGVPLTKAEETSLYPEPTAGNPSYEQPGRDGWIAARAAVPALGAGPPVDPYKTVTLAGLVYSFANCHEDAFLKAAHTLADLSQKWGAGDGRTLEWARAQDQVFQNCAGKEATIPPPLEAGPDSLPASHRRYQRAAAYFYSGQYRKASQAFQEIAGETASPWREIAPYLTARALLRAGMFDGDQDAFHEGKDRLMAILNDPGQAAWHHASSGLLHLWQLRVEPRARIAELDARLTRPNDVDVSQEVIDFLYALNHPQDGGGRKWSSSEIAEVEAKNELAAWLLAMSSTPPADAGEQSVAWWRKTHKSAWLIASLANGPESGLDELLPGARRVAPSDAAYESVVYYASLRERERGHEAEARGWADRALRNQLQTSTRNLILEQRTRLARNWGEFLRFGLRRPEAHMEEFEGVELETSKSPLWSGTAPVFDQDVIGPWNAGVPLLLWVDAASNPILPAAMQLRIAEVAWLRAVLLDRNAEARKLMQRVLDLDPAAGQGAQGFLTAQGAEESRFAALYLVLRSPSLGPWLLAAERQTLHFGEAHYVPLEGCWRCGMNVPPDGARLHRPGFLTDGERATGETEGRKIRTAEPWEATYLARETVGWARKHAEDPRVPEALHRAVMASRYRAKDAETGKYSQQAFALLHQRYGKSEWALRTKYWYQ